MRRSNSRYKGEREREENGERERERGCVCMCVRDICRERKGEWDGERESRRV